MKKLLFSLALFPLSCFADNFDQLIQDATKAFESQDYLTATLNLNNAKKIAFEKAPLTLNNIVLIDEPGTSYSVYKVRENNRYSSQDPIYIYCEPIGYKFKESAGLYELGVTADAEIFNEDGNLVAQQKEFGRFTYQAHQPIMEFALSLTVTLTNFDPGKYSIKIIAHDINSDKIGENSVEVDIVQTGS